MGDASSESIAVQLTEMRAEIKAVLKEVMTLAERVEDRQTQVTKNHEDLKDKVERQGERFGERLDLLEREQAKWLNRGIGLVGGSSIGTGSVVVVLSRLLGG